MYEKFATQWSLCCFFCWSVCLIVTSDPQALLLLLAWQSLQAAPSQVGAFLQHLPPPTRLAWPRPWPLSHLSPHHLAWAASAPVLCLPIPCWAWCNQQWAWGPWAWAWGPQEWAWAWCRPAPWACPTAGSPLWRHPARLCWGLEAQQHLSWFWVGPLEQEEWWGREDQWEAEERREQAPTLFFFEEVSPLVRSAVSTSSVVPAAPFIHPSLNTICVQKEKCLHLYI